MEMSWRGIGGWRLGSLYYGMKLGVTNHDRMAVLSGFFVNRDYRVKTDMGVFHCPDFASVYQFNPRWERFVRSIIGAARNSLFVDVGANIGFYSVMAARNGNRVVSIEPNPTAYRCLVENLAGYSGVEPHNAAAWNDNIPLKLAIGRKTDVSRVSNDGVDVQGVRLDHLLRERPDLLKIDAEGAELEILQGLGALRPRSIVYEALTSRKKADLFDYLKRLNYSVQKLDSTNYLADEIGEQST